MSQPDRLLGTLNEGQVQRFFLRWLGSAGSLQEADLREMLNSSAASEIAPKTRGAYEPLTEAEIEDWRKNIKNKIFSDFDGEPNEAHGKTLQASFDRLCDMAINCRLYAEEIQRLRSTPVSATEPFAWAVFASDTHELIDVTIIAPEIKLGIYTEPLYKMATAVPAAVQAQRKDPAPLKDLTLGAPYDR